ncbi:lytic murein transglycosylase B [Catenovulum sp. SM1970]|uniref:lytic murein transglycosylase B n=1 Tax=Marinifaba aquimaris TaxID=2741323 RepID=UPI001574D45D|nr:lytic murein transglycosylase B [Marinifaba aquimaris]NTS75744.1 lytic murein transglycosylase B [Marinifaba aquimaris]
MIKKLLIAGLMAVGFASSPAIANSESQFIDDLVNNHGFEREYVKTTLAKAAVQQGIIDSITKPWEAKPWYKYRTIFLKPERVEKGVAFWLEHQEALRRVEKELGVDAELVVAIIAVESYFGQYLGKHKVLDSLYTLGFHYPKRAKFFKKELKEFFLLSREEGFDMSELKGSYAGAMGWGQFISSSYRHYAIDFDGDGVRDLINNPVDAIGSVANYFKKHGWKLDAAVTVPAEVQGEQYKSVLTKGNKPKLKAIDILAKGVNVSTDINAQQKAKLQPLEIENGDEYWLTFHNFYAITRYNHSPLYAMAVYQLSQQIAAQKQQLTMAKAK